MNIIANKLTEPVELIIDSCALNLENKHAYMLFPQQRGVI